MNGVTRARPFTQQGIANLVGASRDLVIGGYVSIEPHRIVIRRKLPARW